MNTLPPPRRVPLIERNVGLLGGFALFCAGLFVGLAVGIGLAHWSTTLSCFPGDVEICGPIAFAMLGSLLLGVVAIVLSVLAVVAAVVTRRYGGAAMFAVGVGVSVFLVIPVDVAFHL